MTESYGDDKFWDLYGEFLKESEQRHVEAVSSLLPIKYNNSIIDLGCGQYASASKLIPYDDYMGIDISKPGVRSDLDRSYFVQGNYRTLDIKAAFDGFVSLFSSEITANEKDNTAFYHKIFQNTKASWGLVSGFYYRGKEDSIIIKETGSIKSYQTFPWLPSKTPLYSIKQYCVNAPSKMFGQDVVEVWRLMVKNVYDHDEHPTLRTNPPPSLL